MERKALGRGLASLIPTSPPPPQLFSTAREENQKPTESSNSILMIPTGSIIPNRSQPRKNFDEHKMAELIESIREKGILVPLIVAFNQGRYDLISGERRLRASIAIGLTEVPVVLREAGASEQLELALIENIQRQDLDPIEEAAAYELLMDQFGYTQEAVAKRVGRERTTVANLLRLLKLPTEIKQALQSGKISMGHARALLAVSEMERQLYFVKKIAEEGWSVRELEKRVEARRTVGASGPVRNLPPLPIHLLEIIDEFRRVLGTQVRIVPSIKKQGDGLGSIGKIFIDYYSEADLDRIYNIITRK